MNIKNLCRVCDSTYTKEDAIAEVEKACNFIEKYDIEYNPEIPDIIDKSADNTIYSTSEDYDKQKSIAKEIFYDGSSTESKKLKEELLDQFRERLLVTTFAGSLEELIDDFEDLDEETFETVKTSIIDAIKNSEGLDVEKFISYAEEFLERLNTEEEKEYWDGTLNYELPDLNEDYMCHVWLDCLDKAAETLEGEVAKDVDIDINDVDW